MKKSSVILLSLLFFSFQYVIAKPILKQAKYLIGCQQNEGSGVVGIGKEVNGLYYPLAFYGSRNSDSALESDYWIIKEEFPGEYSFRNAETLQYIRYQFSAEIERTALVMVDNLQLDKSTLFKLMHKEDGGISYYQITSIVYNNKGWNKRGDNGTLSPLGIYNVGMGNNECFNFYTSDGVSASDDAKVQAELPNAGPNLGSFSSSISAITFSNKVPVCDIKSKELFLSIHESFVGSNLPVDISFVLKDASHKLYINNKLVTNEAAFTFQKVETDKQYTIEVRSSATVISSGFIVFTTLPLLQLYTDVGFKSVYSLARMLITEPQVSEQAENLIANIRYRGAYAQSQPKKAFAIKLKDSYDAETSIDRSFMGLRSDNNWILDAMAVDPGRIRNRVSTDLWNDFSTLPYFSADEPKMINGTRGGYVEVFVNDSYNGLYCMTEKIDRKQLQLRKFKKDTITNVFTQRGGLYKAKQWSVSTLMGNGRYGSSGGKLNDVPYYSNKSEGWGSYEVKYPDLGDGEEINWKPLYNAVVTASHHTPDQLFINDVPDFFDMPVFIDYYLFIEFIFAVDNHGKNTYISVYDQTKSKMVSITPWDLDGTWGRSWDGTIGRNPAGQSFHTFLNQNNSSAANNLFNRLRSLNVDDYEKKLINRYYNLRGSYFNHESIMSRFRAYYNQFELSGAARREIERWGVSDFEIEYSYISNWVESRLQYLDKQYLGKPYVSSNEGLIQANAVIFPSTVHNQLTISNVVSGNMIQVVNMQGVLITQFVADSDELQIDMSTYPSGIYIVRINNQSRKIVKM